MDNTTKPAPTTPKEVRKLRVEDLERSVVKSEKKRKLEDPATLEEGDTVAERVVQRRRLEVVRKNETKIQAGTVADNGKLVASPVKGLGV